MIRVLLALDDRDTRTFYAANLHTAGFRVTTSGTREALQAEGVPTRVVSMPCVEWFEEQDQGYRDSVLPPSVKARVAVEAGIGLTWHKYVGDAGRIVSLEHFGASADGKLLFQDFGFTAENVAAKARESLAAAQR